MKTYKVFVNNGYRFEFVGTQQGESIIAARREWLRLNEGTNAGNPQNVKLKR